MSFPKYGSYKQSGVRWIAEVPDHWDVVALKYIASLKSGDSITGESIYETGDFPVYGGNGLRGYTDDFTHYGHFVVVGRQGALCGNINYATGKFWASEHAVVASPLKEVETIWLGEMLQAMNLNQYSVSAAQPGLSMELVGNLRTVVPPLDEQQSIASFLDAETSKIDGLVSEQRRLIELLKEKRQAVISHAVTKGLNPDVAMKPSGVEWLGEVPEGWEVKKIKYLFQFSKRQNYPDETVLSVYRDFGIIDKSTRNDNNNKTPLDLSSYQLVEPGDLVINKMKAWQGSLGISQLRGITSPDYLVFRSTNNEHLPFLHLLLRSKQMAKLYHSLSNGVRLAQWRVETDKFEQIFLCLPSLEEQKEISELVESQLAAFDKLSAEAERAITLLQERRTALISAAVTGKIDVREFALQEVG